MAKKGVIHKGSGRPRTFVGVIQGITRDLQAQREAREQQRRKDRLCESLRQTDITPRPLSGLSGATAVRRDSDDLFASGRDRRDTLTRGRGSSLGGRHEYNDRSYQAPSWPRHDSSRPYRAPSPPPPRYPSSSSNARSAGLQRSATFRGDSRAGECTRTRDLPSHLSSVLENRRPHPRDLEVRAIEPGDMPRQVQIGRRTTVAGRQVTPAEFRGDYPGEYERTRETAREARPGREGYFERESRLGRDRYEERGSYGRDSYGRDR